MWKRQCPKLDGTMAAPSPAARPWTGEEHTRFIDGLEMYGAQPSPWALIASCVESRSEAETKEHGEFYLHALLTQSLLEAKSEWTADENTIFENALAESSPPCWSKIAMLLPGKSVYDVMDHYERLVRDITAIEKGINLTTSSIESELRVANMELIESIAAAKDNPELFDAFKVAHETVCPVDTATSLASAVVNMVALDEDKRRLKPSASNQTKAAVFVLPPLGAKRQGTY
ncbi:hypothetical protein ACHHYP_15620 [Achlya hypogyna]|uniref:Myb-like domain-containing protein n=1 Tax=Achlya hypogyna TaxID=1202772 RepID=A0A1V9YAH2_ACHHY|nr:hypothetical protein ACHHYP_15620 [Achlya hypogyna]